MRIKASLLVSVFFLSLLVPMTPVVSAQEPQDVVVLTTAVNPANNHTYHLLSESSWDVAAEVARGLDGFLVTIDDAEENQWVFDTFAMWENQTHHLWTGLSDIDNDGEYRWHNGAPFYYRDWGVDQPSASDDEGYVHIAGTNMGNIMPGTWNDLEIDPQYFPVYGVVEVGPGADYSLRFDGQADHIEVAHSDSLNISESLLLSAWVFPYTDEGIQFVAMKGDYGWGMYLNEGTLAYASEYSLSQHPTANQTIEADEWSHIEVEVIEGVGGEFRINGLSAGNISSENAIIPAGDFGSNDCFTSGDSCDELYIGSMGAGCDCNYFHGLLDNVSIGTGFSNPTSNVSWTSNWTFAEGEGATTHDDANNTGEIYGADWVMPDGTIVAQAIELESGDVVEGIDGQSGDNLLFFATLDELTMDFYFNLYPGEFKVEETIIDIYFGHEEIPSSWEHDLHIEANWGYALEQFSWPQEGTWWMLLVPQSDIEDYSISVEWEVAAPPPGEDEMTQLINGIPVTGQTIDVGRQADMEERVLYYYVDVEQNLSSLTVSTYGGTGNINIGLSWGTVPDPFNFWFFEGDDDLGGNPNEGKITYETGQGNEHDATLYDVEPGRYYVTAYTFQRAFDYTIVATMAFAPDNTEPEDAIELTPGVAYGPLTGYDGLDQYFKINVPTGTERLEVDLSEGYGEATMYMRLEQFPTAGEFDVQSASPGAGDKIAFNDPTPGTWFILLTTEDVFANIMITASFEDRYIWTYDGTPIELFNGEEITGLEAPADESLFFFVELENPGMFLEVNTYGGQGTLVLEGSGNVVAFDFGGPENQGVEDEKGRQGRPTQEDLTSEAVDVKAEGDGTTHVLYVQMPANGRFDITLTIEEAITDVSIMATWEDSQLPPVDEPEDPDNDGIVDTSCEDEAVLVFEEADRDGDGVISEREFQSQIESDDIQFEDIDLNDDGEIEYREVLQEACSCSNELDIIASQLLDDGKGLGVESFDKLDIKNEYDAQSMDNNKDKVVSIEELEIASIICTTTFDAFDGDGDGVNDEDDAFPEDPDESEDTDGDGVGDNADLAPSVANDLIYGSIGLVGAVVFIVLLLVGLGFTRSGPDRPDGNDWDEMKQQDIASQMLGMETNETPDLEPQAQETPPDMYSSEPTLQQSTGFEPPVVQQNMPVQSMEAFNDLLDPVTPAAQPPSQQLMGMLDASGNEVLEYPAGSGVQWTRASPSDAWHQR